MTIRGSSATYALIFASIAAAATGQLLIKAGVGSAGGQTSLQIIQGALVNPMVVGGFLAYALSSALWLVVLSRAKLSIAYPLGAINYVVIVGFSILLGEHVPPLRWVAVAVIITGIVLITVPHLGPKRERPTHAR